MINQGVKMNWKIATILKIFAKNCSLEECYSLKNTPVIFILTCGWILIRSSFSENLKLFGEYPQELGGQNYQK